MSIIKTVRGQTPIFGNNVFLADNSVVIGEVSMGDDCSVWFNAVIRGDVNFIKIGDRVNIQDGAVIHCTYEKSGTTIGNDVSIGHSAIVHGCTIHDKALIGMGAIVMECRGAYKLPGGCRSCRTRKYHPGIRVYLCRGSRKKSKGTIKRKL